MHWLPFLRGLWPPPRSASSPVRPQTPAAPIVYDPDLAHWIHEQFLRSVEAALAARGWTSEVPEDVVTGWNVALPHFYAPYTRTGVRTIRTRFAALGPHFASLITALDEVLDIQRGGTVGVDFDTVLATKMRNVDGLPSDFYQRFELVIGTTTPGGVAPAVELTIEVQPGSTSEPARLGEGEGGLFTSTASILARSQVLSAERLAKADPLLYEFLAKMIHGARFYRNRFFLCVDGLTFGVGTIEPLAPPTATPQHLQTPASSTPPHPIHPKPLSDRSASSFARFVVLAALYPQFIDEDSLNARLQHIIVATGTRDVGEPSSAVAGDKTALSSSTSSSAPTYPHTSPSSTSVSAMSNSVTLVWPDKVSTAMKPVEPVDLQVRLSALQQETGFDADDSPCLQLFPASGGTMKLEQLIHASEQLFAYRRRLDGQRIVGKAGRCDWENLIVDEAAASILAYQRKAAVPKLLGVLEGRDPVDDRRIVVAAYPDCGDALRLWTDLSLQQRISLLLDLVYLHQHAHLEHGDAAPRNTLVDVNGKTRWIDLSAARAHETCDGADCWELSEVCSEMELWDEEEAVREAASGRGLRW